MNLFIKNKWKDILSCQIKEKFIARDIIKIGILNNWFLVLRVLDRTTIEDNRKKNFRILSIGFLKIH